VYGVGIDTMGEYIDLAAQFGIINKKGSWYQYQDTSIGQGKQNAIKYLSDNENVLHDVKLEIRKFLFNE
jgi:recombination protein RecA